MVLDQVSSNESPRVQDGPSERVLGSNPRNTLKNIKKSSSEPLGLEMLEICYVALHSGPLPSLFK